MEKIDPGVLNDVFLDCLYREDEVVDGKPPEGTAKVAGITMDYGFHPGRLESHRMQVLSWLTLLPHTFRKNSGGGWSFLMAATQEDGLQWTDLHKRMEELFVLGIALGYASFLVQREMWKVLPGGMPYIVLDL